jgi:hypothetical protein
VEILDHFPQQPSSDLHRHQNPVASELKSDAWILLSGTLAQSVGAAQQPTFNSLSAPRGRKGPTEHSGVLSGFSVAWCWGYLGTTES